MFRKTIVSSLLASSALVLAVTTPAYAGKGDRAREAISAAEAKIQAGRRAIASVQSESARHVADKGSMVAPVGGEGGRVESHATASGR